MYIPAVTPIRCQDSVELCGTGLWFSHLYRAQAPDDVCAVADLSDKEHAYLEAVRPDLCGLTMDRPRIMGILNVTPDSFSDGGAYGSCAEAVAQVRSWGADVDIIDIGGESTRPGADEVTVVDEILRVAPVIRALRDAGITTPISIDTRKAPVAEAALEAGADMVNDVSALRFDPELADVVAARGVPVCLMHAQGLPKDMQDHPTYGARGVCQDVFEHLAERIAFAVDKGIAHDRIVADPGIGFGKTVDNNLSLLRDCAGFHGLGVPLLVGVSRKRFIGEIGQAEAPKARMPGSVAVALSLTARGVQVLRVHDVSASAQALRLWRAVEQGIK